MSRSQSEDSDSVSETTRLMDGHVATNSSNTPLEVRREAPKRKLPKAEAERGQGVSGSSNQQVRFTNCKKKINLNF